MRKTYELLTSLPENSYFIFSYADVIIFPNRKFDELIKHYIGLSADIVFMKEAPDLEISNIGFSLIKVCEANKKLFRDAIDKCENEPTSLDQSVVNQVLKSYTGKHYYFPSENVGTSSTLIYFKKQSNDVLNNVLNNLIVFQALCNPTHGTDSAVLQKLHQYKMFGINVP